MNQIDPRGPRFGAVVTSAVLAAVLVTGSVVLLGAQVAVFALGAAGRSPLQLLYRSLVRPRLSPPAELEDEAPTRFAQLVGLSFTGAALIALLAGATALGYVLTGFALVAALLNASTGLCLGCEVYLLWKRTTTKRITNKGVTA
jgi:hypothetical protein